MNLIKLFLGVIKEPVKFFQNKFRIKDILEYLIAINLIVFVLMSIFRFFLESYGLQELSLTVLLFLAGLLLIILLSYFSAYIFHLVSKYFFKIKSNFKEMFSIYVYSSTPLVLASFFSFMEYYFYIIPLFLIWNYALIVLGISVKFKVKKLISFFICLVSFLILFLLAGIVSNLVIGNFV